MMYRIDEYGTVRPFYNYLIITNEVTQKYFKMILCQNLFAQNEIRVAPHIFCKFFAPPKKEFFNGYSVIFIS